MIIKFVYAKRCYVLGRNVKNHVLDIALQNTIACITEIQTKALCLAKKSMPMIPESLMLWL